MMDAGPTVSNRATVPDSRSGGQGPRGRVLLVEDDRVNQQVGVLMLERLGYHVDVVADGSEAVEAATRTPYLAVLMDCQIPVLDGYQATGEIRRRQATSRHTPIIAVTSSVTTSDEQRAVAAGMDDYLAKPLSLTSLGAVLDRWASPDLAVVDGSAAPVPAIRADVALAGDPAPAALDVSVLGRLERLGRAAGEDLVAALAALFLTDADVRVAALRRALAADDHTAVVRSAHPLSGASANIGATGLARLCAALATAGAAGDLTEGPALLDLVEAELARVRSALVVLTRTP